MSVKTEFNESVNIKGFSITRNVDIYLHKPLPKKEYKSVNDKIKDIHDLGLLKQHVHVANDVVDGGEIWITELLAGREAGGSTLSYGAGTLGWGLQYIMVGTGGIATVQTDDELVTFLSPAKAATTAFDAGANNKFTVSCTFAEGEANGGLIEAGIFSNSTPTSGLTATSTNNRMFNRTFFTVINKSASFELTVKWTITIGTIA